MGVYRKLPKYNVYYIFRQQWTIWGAINFSQQWRYPCWPSGFWHFVTDIWISTHIFTWEPDKAISKSHQAQSSAENWTIKIVKYVDISYSHQLSIIYNESESTNTNMIIMLVTNFKLGGLKLLGQVSNGIWGDSTSIPHNQNRNRDNTY